MARHFPVLQGVVMIFHGVKQRAQQLKRQPAVGCHMLKEKTKKTNSIAK
jgi:hypothetical protein